MTCFCPVSFQFLPYKYECGTYSTLMVNYQEANQRFLDNTHICCPFPTSEAAGLSVLVSRISLYHQTCVCDYRHQNSSPTASSNPFGLLTYTIHSFFMTQGCFCPVSFQSLPLSAIYLECYGIDVVIIQHSWCISNY